MDLGVGGLDVKAALGVGEELTVLNPGVGEGDERPVAVAPEDAAADHGVAILHLQAGGGAVVFKHKTPKQ